MVEDRFKKLSHNYAEHFAEVFALQGFYYGEFQKSMFNEIEKLHLDKNVPILDIGCGDGESLVPFVHAGYSNLVGIDLNQEMLDSANITFGNKVTLFREDATDMSKFNNGDFEVIITRACIHNIPKHQRINFWKELIRLYPKVFVAAEKIADIDPIKHKKSYDSEVGAILKVYKDTYDLPDIAKEWIEHYEYDEREKLTFEEIANNLSKEYDLSLVYEVGMYKTILAIRKK